MQQGMGITGKELSRLNQRIRATNYLTVAQLFLTNNFLLQTPLAPADVKSRLLGHWGTCPGINSIYANLHHFFTSRAQAFQFILGPGHGFPALQANLFFDGDLEQIDPKATRDAQGIAYLCKNFSFPGGFPSHSSPLTPTVITEGGELGYSLGAAYGAILGHPEKTVAVLLGDGEFETGSALASMNLGALLGGTGNGRVLPILHLNGYKISGPTVFARRSEHEQNQLIRGFGFTPIVVPSDDSEQFQFALAFAQTIQNPFLIFKSDKGATGPEEVDGQKVADNYLAHQIPLPLAKTDPTQLKILEDWLKSYHFEELFDPQKGFTI
ncbi:hypothetical protein IJF89_00360 [Candidatus Saccharibacteria bacterium]|nr:hypothetical protein [Candidatus Saccharibacteria bacterium]